MRLLHIVVLFHKKKRGIRFVKWHKKLNLNLEVSKSKPKSKSKSCYRVSSMDDAFLKQRGSLKFGNLWSSYRAVAQPRKKLDF